MYFFTLTNEKKLALCNNTPTDIKDNIPDKARIISIKTVNFLYGNKINENKTDNIKHRDIILAFALFTQAFILSLNIFPMP